MHRHAAGNRQLLDRKRAAREKVIVERRALPFQSELFCLSSLLSSAFYFNSLSHNPNPLCRFSTNLINIERAATLRTRTHMYQKYMSSRHFTFLSQDYSLISGSSETASHLLGFRMQRKRLCFFHIGQMGETNSILPCGS